MGEAGIPKDSKAGRGESALRQIAERLKMGIWTYMANLIYATTS
jgi:hypothetical protein